MEWTGTSMFIIFIIKATIKLAGRVHLEKQRRLPRAARAYDEERIATFRAFKVLEDSWRAISTV
jgi:hypothetical protein